MSGDLRKSAKGQSCTLRLKGCDHDTSTVVLAHIGIKGHSGMAMKAADYKACFACHNCHDIIDGRKKGVYDHLDILRAVFETWDIWAKSGLINIKGYEFKDHFFDDAF